MSDRGLIVSGTVSIAVTSTTANVNLNIVSDIVVVQNTGSKTAYINLGGPTVTATTAGFPLTAGSSVSLDQGGNQYAAAICGGSDTTTVYFSVCSGVYHTSNVTQASSGGSGTVTSFSVVPANGVSATVANPTTTPAATFTLGDITPSSISIGAGSVITTSGPGGALASGAFTTAYTLPTASTSVLGGVKVDGTSITISSGVISATPGGSGTVTSVSVVSANGLAGTVANATTTPAITISTSITGILQGNGTAISAASTTGSGNVVLAGSPALTGTPTAPTPATSDNSTTVPTTAYVQANIAAVTAGLDFKNPVYVSTTANLNATYVNGVSGVGATLTNAGSLAAFSVDGQSPAINSRVLVKNQSTAYQNGIYTLTTIGSGAVAWILTRSTDYNSTAQIAPGDLIPVQFGTLNGDSVWLQTATVSTIGTDSITFSEYLYPASTFFHVANNLSEGTPATMQTNIGLAFAVGGGLIGKLIGANLNSTSDQALTMIGGITNFAVTDIIFTNASGTPSTAVGGLYTAASKGGVALVYASQTYASLTAASKLISRGSVGIIDGQTHTGTLYFSLTTPQGSAMTADIYVLGYKLDG